MILLWGCESSDSVTYEMTNKINTQSQSFTGEKDEILRQAILQNECHNETGYFVDYALLGTGTDDENHLIYYLLSKGQQYEVMNGVLISRGGFSNIPTKIVFEKTETGMHLLSYEISLDGSLYVSSIKAMFPSEVFAKWENHEGIYQNTQSFLEQAEEYFGVKVFSDENQNFSCSFCDQVWYEKEEPEELEESQEGNKSEPSLSIRATLTNVPQSGGKSYYFGSDGGFWTKGRRNEGSWTWKFWVNEKDLIVSMEKTQHVYDRYTILEMSGDTLKLDLNILQK